MPPSSISSSGTASTIMMGGNPNNMNGMNSMMIPLPITSMGANFGNYIRQVPMNFHVAVQSSKDIKKLTVYNLHSAELKLKILLSAFLYF